MFCSNTPFKRSLGYCLKLVIGYRYSTLECFSLSVHLSMTRRKWQYLQLFYSQYFLNRNLNKYYYTLVIHLTSARYKDLRMYYWEWFRPCPLIAKQISFSLAYNKGTVSILHKARQGKLEFLKMVIHSRYTSHIHKHNGSNSKHTVSIARHYLFPSSETKRNMHLQHCTKGCNNSTRDTRLFLRIKCRLFINQNRG